MSLDMSVKKLTNPSTTTLDGTPLILSTLFQPAAEARGERGEVLPGRLGPGLEDSGELLIFEDPLARRFSRQHFAQYRSHAPGLDERALAQVTQGLPDLFARVHDE